MYYLIKLHGFHLKKETHLKVLIQKVENDNREKNGDGRIGQIEVIEKKKGLEGNKIEIVYTRIFTLYLTSFRKT